MSAPMDIVTETANAMISAPMDIASRISKAVTSSSERSTVEEQISFPKHGGDLMPRTEDGMELLERLMQQSKNPDLRPKCLVGQNLKAVSNMPLHIQFLSELKYLASGTFNDVYTTHIKSKYSAQPIPVVYRITKKAVNLSTKELDTITWRSVYTTIRMHELKISPRVFDVSLTVDGRIAYLSEKYPINLKEFIVDHVARMDRRTMAHVLSHLRTQTMQILTKMVQNSVTCMDIKPLNAVVSFSPDYSYINLRFIDFEADWCITLRDADMNMPVLRKLVNKLQRSGNDIGSFEECHLRFLIVLFANHLYSLSKKLSNTVAWNIPINYLAEDVVAMKPVQHLALVVFLMNPKDETHEQIASQQILTHYFKTGAPRYVVLGSRRHAQKMHGGGSSRFIKMILNHKEEPTIASKKKKGPKEPKEPKGPKITTKKKAPKKPKTLKTGY